MDEGARYVGEFALGVNPFVTRAMNNILFDEKISGSFHFTPGMCYDECPNGNHSALHWDLAVSYTHLDVYKRQRIMGAKLAPWHNRSKEQNQ